MYQFFVKTFSRHAKKSWTIVAMIPYMHCETGGERPNI